MKGLLYKEIKQNKKFIFLSSIVSIISMILPLLFISLIERCSLTSVFRLFGEGLTAKIIWLVFIVLGYFIVGSIQGRVFRDDNNKAWSIFIASSPKGIKGYLQVKYEVVFFMCMLSYICCCVCNYVLGFFSLLSNNEIFDMMFWLNYFLFLQIIIRSIEIVFTIRFGYKLGNYIKLFFMISLTIVISMIVIFDPGNIMNSLVNELLTRRSENIKDTFLFFISLCPIVAMLLFYFSYKASCVFYLKGCGQYAK